MSGDFRLRSGSSRLGFYLIPIGFLGIVVSPNADAGNIWDGGSSTNDNIDNRRNWDGSSGGVVNSLDGTNSAVFGTGGSAAVINVDASFIGISLNRDSNFSITNGNGSLTVGSGGITMTLPSTTGRTHTISESSLILGTNQIWSVANNTGSAQLNVSSVVSGSGYGITKSETGTLQLSGNNTYSGLTTVSGGTLALGNYNALQNSTLDTGTSGSQAVTFTAGTGIYNIGGLQGADALSIGANTLSLGANNASTSFTGVISGTGGNVRKLGSGTLTLSGSNTYSGLTDVQAGTLALGASNVFANNSTLKVSGGTLSLGANSDTVAGVQLTGGSITSSTGVLVSTTDFDLQSGSVTANLDGAVNVTKTTAGTVFLSGNNSYTGVTTFGAGIVNVANLSDYGVTGSLGMRAVDTNPPVSNVGLRFVGGTLQYTGSTPQSTNRDIRVGLQGGTIDASGSNPSATMSFTKSTPNVDVWDTDGARTLTLTGSNTGDNTFAINWQERAAGHSSIVKSGAGTWVLTNIHNSDAQTNDYNAYGGYGGGTTIAGGTLGFVADAIGGGVVDFTGNATLRWESGNTQDITSGSGAGVDRSVRIGDGVTATFNTNGNNVALSNAFALGTLESGALTKAGAGNLTLSAVNTYTGATTISEGKLTISSTGTINSTSAVSIGAGEFSYNSATALTKNVSFSGTGGTLSGTGTITNAVTVTTGNTYSAGAVGDPGTQAFTNGIDFQAGSIFSWDLDAPSADPGANSVNAGTYDKVTGNGSGTGIFNLVLGQNLFSDAFWDTNKTWTDIFSGSDPVFTLFSGGDGVSTVASNGVVFGQGQFSFSSGSLNWTSSSGVGPISPVPEPTSALAGILIGAGLLRRKRR